MTGAPEANLPTPDASTARHRARWHWRHSSFSFVLAVFSRYLIDFYKDREVHMIRRGTGAESWTDEDRALAIEEGRRQIDAQHVQLAYLTRRATALLPVGVAVSAFFLSQFDVLDDTARCARILLLAAMGMTTWGALIMGALIGGRSGFKTVDTVQLTNEPGNLLEYLARDYAENVPKGESTNAARLTHLGTGIAWIAAGTILGLIVLAVSQ